MGTQKVKTILQVNNNHGGGGVEAVMHLLDQNMAKRKCRGLIMTSSPGIEDKNHIYTKSILNRGYKRIEGGESKPVKDKQNLMRKKRLVALYRSFLFGSPIFRPPSEILASKGPIDIIHLHNIQSYGKGLFRWLRRRRTPHILSLHGYWPICPNSILFKTSKEETLCKENNWKKCRKCGSLPTVGRNVTGVMKLMQSCKTIVCVSEYQRQRMIDFGFSHPDLRVIHNGVDTEFFKPKANYTNLEKRKFILYVGRLGFLKGSEIVIEVAKRLPEYQFVFVGGSAFGSGTTPDNITLLPWSSKLSLVALYQDAIFTMVPSLWPEPHPVVCLESMSCGTPVISSGLGGIRETIEESGIIVSDYADPQAYVDAIQATDSKSYSMMSRRSRRAITTNFTDQQMLEQYFSLYKQHAG